MQEKARHRLCGDEKLDDMDATIRGQIDREIESDFCQKMFASIDKVAYIHTYIHTYILHTHTHIL